VTVAQPPAPSARTVADFDARAASWDEDPSKVERARAVAEAIAREVRLSPAMRALEYGAGTGLLSFLLRERLGEITLADVSDGMLDVARAKIAAAGDARMRALKLDLGADDSPAGPFDVVYSLMTLHHIPDTDRILHRFFDVLASPGMLLVADLDAEDGAFHGEGFEGHNGFDRGTLGARTIAAGFAEVRFVTAFEMRKEAGGTMRTFPIFLMVAIKGGP
jgi:ubiquinone/menaquinone biosynthesis C-methylase UbiE